MSRATCQPKRLYDRAPPSLWSPILTNFAFGFACLRFQRRKRLALEWNVFWVRPSIGQALAVDALGAFIGAARIVNAPDLICVAAMRADPTVGQTRASSHSRALVSSWKVGFLRRSVIGLL